MGKKQYLSVVMITNNFTPYMGGVTNSIKAYKEELERQGHAVTVITLDFTGKRTKGEQGVLRIPSALRFSYKGNYMAIPYRSHGFIKKTLRKIQPDVVHIHHPWVLGPAGLRAAKSLSIPVVFTYHTPYEKYAHYVPLVPKKLVQWATLRMVDRFCKKVDHIISPSESIKNIIQKRGIKKSISVLPSPLKAEFFHDTLPERKKRDGLQLLMVSRLTKEKNIEFLLDVFSRLNMKRYTFMLMGFGYHYPVLKEQAYQTLKIPQNRLKFLVKKPNKTLIEYYKTSDLFLFSSPADAQGLVLAEAMAAGTPVIALKAPGQNDIVKDGFNGFLVNNKQEMKEAIERIEKDPALLASLQKGAWQTAQKYKAPLLAKKMIDVYSAIL